MKPSSSACETHEPAAPARDKLAVLRSVSADDLNQVSGPGVSPPTYDPDFYPGHDTDTYMEDSKPFPSWLKGLVIGSTKAEAAMWVRSNITEKEAASTIRSAFEDFEFVEEL